MFIMKANLDITVLAKQLGIAPSRLQEWIGQHLALSIEATVPDQTEHQGEKEA